MRRLRRPWLVLAFAPALAGAQNAKGPCPGSVGLDSALQEYVTKPDHKPRRKQDGVVPTVADGSFTLATAAQDYSRNVVTEGGAKFVVLVGVVDTTGKLEPTSLAITESPYGVLTDAVCTAALQMEFDPATTGGRKVPAVYRERFNFRQVMGVEDPTRLQVRPHP
jgi:hypothetical protein